MDARKFIITSGLAVAGMLPLAGQSSYDAALLTGSELNGTARFVGMGGAMGALGGDISVIGTNPAGIGIYRSHDLSISFGFNNTSASSTFNGVNMKQDRTRVSLDQAGIVYSSKIGNRTPLRYVNFAFNYHKSRNFNRLFNMGGNLDGFSQTFQIASMTNAVADYSVNGFDENSYYDLINHSNPYTDYSWGDVSTLTKMGVRTGVTEWSSVDNEAIGWLGKANEYYSREEGGINQYDLNVAFNVEDRFYFGLTLGVYDVNYSKSSYYIEDLWMDDGTTDNGGYRLDNYFHADGSGVNLKLGAIVRPFAYSPFRIGFAVHTPTWYNLTYHYSSRLESAIQAVDNGAKYYQDTFEALGGDCIYDYQFSTPWLFNVNVGTTFGGVVAVGAEYEYQDYSSCRFADMDGNEFYSSTDEIENNLKGVHTVRLGIESFLTPQFAIRGGYNYTTTAFKDDAFKPMAYYETRTDTEYENLQNQHTVTLGMGYRGKMFYADMAYKYNMYKSEFRPFDDVALPAAKVDNDRHQLLLTLGLRF